MSARPTAVGDREVPTAACGVRSQWCPDVSGMLTDLAEVPRMLTDFGGVRRTLTLSCSGSRR